MKHDQLRYDLKIIASWIESGSKVLGLGCGEGDLLFWLKKEKKCNGTGHRNRRTQGGKMY